MGRGSNKAPTCDCGSCKKCKNRAYAARKRAGVQPKFVPQGRKIDPNIAAAREEKKLRKTAAAKEEEERKAKMQRQRAKTLARRATRDCAFKKNRLRYGLPKAKMIAATITRRQNENYIPRWVDIKFEIGGFIDDVGLDNP